MSWRTQTTFVPFVLLSMVAVASASDLSSTSFTARGGHLSVSGGVGLTSASFSAAASVGQSEAIGLSGASTGLTTSAPGFIPIVAGGIPDLDHDGDGIAYFLDTDDDGDGLDDAVETNTGIFGSPSDTGTDSLIDDTDGDGVLDGTEVAAGSDPNDSMSLPGPISVPLLGPIARGIAVLALTFASLRALRLAQRKRT